MKIIKLVSYDVLKKMLEMMSCCCFFPIACKFIQQGKMMEVQFLMILERQIGPGEQFPSFKTRW